MGSGFRSEEAGAWNDGALGEFTEVAAFAVAGTFRVTIYGSR